MPREIDVNAGLNACSLYTVLIIMARLIVSVLVLLTSCALSPAVVVADALPLTIYVSPTGDDRWSGRLAEPNADRSDGPVATPAAARDALRKLRNAAPAQGQGGRIVFAAGTYVLPEPLLLEPQDGGRGGAFVDYVSAGDGEAMLSGGVRITGWQVQPDGRWTVTLPEVKAGRWNFAQLYVNGQRRMRPRLPKQGYHHIAGRLPPTEPKPAGGRGEQGDDRFRFSGDQIRADWKNLSDVEVITFHPWFTSMLRIAEADPQTRVVRFSGGTRTTASFGHLAGGMRFLVENVAEALTEPGEWYLDRPSGVLTYIPLPGEKPDTAEVIAPRLEQLVIVRGAADGIGPQVEGVRFRGLSFAHTGWVTPPGGSSISQAAVTVPAAVSAVGANNVQVERCQFVRLGGYGLEFGPGSMFCGATDNRLLDLGAGGIKIGSTSQPRSDEGLARRIDIFRNEIAHGGRVHPAAVGVWIGHAAWVDVENNGIYDFYYTGVSAGWSWGYAKTRNDNINIIGNHIHHLGQGVLSDMAGIYTLGRSGSSFIKGNRIHDVTRDKYGGWGIYYDEGSTGFRSWTNLLYRCQDGGFHQHYGTKNVFENNVIVDSGEVAWGPTRIDSPASPGNVSDDEAFTFERNIIVGWGGQSVVRPEATSKLVAQHPDKLVVNHNVYWNGGAEPRFGRLSLQEWQKWGLDVKSLVIDPKLPPPDSSPFVVPADTPARRVEFRPFRIDPLELKWGPPDLDAGRWPRWFPPANDGKPRAIRDDFETTPAGETPDFAVSHEDGPATVRVSTDAAFVGKRSLKFTDAKAIKHGYDPHLVYSPVNFKAGVAVVKFAMRCDGGATLMHEWRGPGYPYATGPSIQLSGDGSVKTAGNRLLAKVKPGEWVQVEIRCALGGAAAGIYQAVITPAGQPPITIADLACSKEFVDLHWMGFMGVGDRGVAYLDEFSLEPQQAKP